MDNKSSINVGGLNFGWDLEEGRFSFEGRDAVLFWIDTAMKEFFDTIEEISGHEAAEVVMETAGFRQGLVVGEYFMGLKEVSAEEASRLITNTYASAGWGLAEIRHLNLEKKTLEVHLKDSWEHKINQAQEKKHGGDFLSAHYAGIFTGLFEQNIWYEVKHYQVEGHDATVIRYFPSEETVEKNIHRMVRLKERQEIEKLERLVEEQTAELNEMIREISTPIIPVLEDIVVMPLLGSYDENRTKELLEKTLENLPKHKAEYLILDLTGLNDNFSEHAALLIEQLGAASALIGTETILVGITPKVSMTITSTGINLSSFNCFQTLQHGIHYALAQNGRSIT
ncbi:STAS domain-containing protein [Alkalicoccus saliphilus]|uniref:Anti-anti-sigma factor n=1 Tax=Alkalicoccus saliphilus TaxID=200989 RepID=A0A2T4U984_9BACI|nr:STAS domain-containing protein [Alkalicoccus saliphilus]PTL39962.1 anti-anti-sigma factor [Alkalicoccus saliphilus]